MGHYPALKEFIDQKAGKYKNLRVTYTQGAPPNLLMQDATGATMEEVSIHQWKAEHIDEFLTERLEA
jgi:hypothetical protein